MSDISREELMAMIEVQGKTATAMENIANSMRAISEQNKDLVVAQKGLADSCIVCRQQICDKLIVAVEKKFDEKQVGFTEAKKALSDIKSDTSFLKWVLGSVAMITGITVVIIQFIHWITHSGLPK
jgi:hypothetical protein